MSNKRRVFVSLHHRNALSIRENRKRLHYAAYHWGILISPKNLSHDDDDHHHHHHAFDVSDGIIQYAATATETTTTTTMESTDLNIDGNWHFRAEPNVNLADKPHLLARVMIGKLPREVSYADIHTLLEKIPLPQKDALPVQNCVSWTRAAIRTLQENGLAEKFDIDAFMDKALGFADQRLREYTTTSSCMNYTTRRM